MDADQSHDMVVAGARHSVRHHILVIGLFATLWACSSGGWQQGEFRGSKDQTIVELEEEFSHPFVVPGRQLEARLTESGLVPLIGDRSQFATSEFGFLNYTWEGRPFTLMEGPPSDAWDLNRFKFRGSHYIEFDRGNAVVLPLSPSIRGMRTLGTAYRSFPDWLVQVVVGPPPQNEEEAREVVGDLKAFIHALEFRSA